MQYRADIQQSYKSRDTVLKAKEQKQKTLYGSMKETALLGVLALAVIQCRSWFHSGPLCDVRHSNSGGFIGVWHRS